MFWHSFILEESNHQLKPQLDVEFCLVKNLIGCDFLS
jgi:hypothetical protein